MTSNLSRTRKFPRMNAEFVVAYRHLGTEETAKSPNLAKTRSIGLGGMMFETEAPLILGDKYLIEVMVGDRTIKAPATVVYVEKGKSGLFQNGVEFTEITDDDRDYLLNCYLQQEYRITPE